MFKHKNCPGRKKKNKRGFVPWGDFIEEREKHNKKITDTFVKLLNVESIPHHKNLYTLEAFIKACHRGVFTDYNGTGIYALESGLSQKVASPSEIEKEIIDYSWTHVMWFNK